MWISQEAADIIELLAHNKGRLFSVKEVGRSIDRNRFQEEHLWARHALKALEEKGEIQLDGAGYYFVAKN
jgi:hypothetical protein